MFIVKGDRIADTNKQGSTMIIDMDTGEELNSKFAKLFFDDIQKLYDLTGRHIAVLMMMVRSMNMSDNGIVNMTPEKKKVFAKLLGMKSHQQVTNALNALKRSDVIKKVRPNERFDYRFRINPYLLFKGNDYQRAKVLIDYEEGKRRVIAVVPDKEGKIDIDNAVEKFLNANPEYVDLFSEFIKDGNEK